MNDLRPLSVPSLFDATFQLYRDRFTTFLIIALVVHIPYSLLVAFVLPTGRIEVDARGEPQISAAMALGLVGIFVFAIVFLPLCVAAMTQNISATYLGEDLSAADSYRRAMPRLGWLIITQILVGLVFLAGCFMCVVPGIVFACWFYVTAPIVILEGYNLTAAMTRSRNLVEGNLAKVFLVGLVLFLLNLVFFAIVQIIINLVPGPRLLVMFVASILNAFVLPIEAAPRVLLYYDLRIRKEAFDLQMLALALHKPVPV
jgi:hypothetical protein